MKRKKIVVCLDVKDGRVVKGTNFKNIRDIGDPIELADLYDREGADEIVFLDITATREKRKTTLDMVSKTAERLHIPFIVGGGISDLGDMKDLIDAGADKISINSAAIKNPQLIFEGARKFGRERIIVACDAKRTNQGWEVFTHGGSTPTGIDVIEWTKKTVELGAGEILLTSMDADGTKDGYDISLMRAVAEAVDVPVIASGGAGRKEHFREVFLKGKAAGALAASVFHRHILNIGEIKEYLRSEGIEI